MRGPTFGKSAEYLIVPCCRGGSAMGVDEKESSLVTQTEVAMSDRGSRLPVVQHPADRNPRRSLTLVGLLEGAMWAGGAGVLLAFWLWPSSVETHATARAKTERPSEAL